MKATVELSIIDIDGEVVEPAVLELGTSYTFQALVTNHSVTPGGNPRPADFEIGLGVFLGGMEIAPYVIQPPMTLPPGGACRPIAKVYIPKEYAGMIGNVVANVFDPFGQVTSAKCGFRVSYELSPEAKYKVETGTMKGIILPSLSPDDMTEGVLMGSSAGKTLAPPPAPPKPKLDYSKAKPPSGLDCSTEPEKPAEWEGEVYTGNRIG